MSEPPEKSDESVANNSETDRERQQRERRVRLTQVKTLLAENRTDKEIALRLGINLNLIRKDVAHIRKELGFDNRRDAGLHLAQTLRVHGAPGTPSTLFVAAPSPSLVTPAEEAGQVDRVMEVRATYVAKRQSPDIGLPFRSRGVRRNVLNLLQRMAWIGLLASVAFTMIGFMSIALNSIR